MRLCSVEGCNRPPAARGLCRTHYDRSPERIGQARARMRRHYVHKKRERGSYDGGRVVWCPPCGVPEFSVVPQAIRCVCCRGLAAHVIDVSASHATKVGRRSKIRSGKQRNPGYKICEPCIAFWAKYGRTGTVAPLKGVA